MTKQKGMGGMVTMDTSKAHLLYDIQGPWHFNSEMRVAAILDQL